MLKLVFDRAREHRYIEAHNEKVLISENTYNDGLNRQVSSIFLSAVANTAFSTKASQTLGAVGFLLVYVRRNGHIFLKVEKKLVFLAAASLCRWHRYKCVTFGIVETVKFDQQS